MYTTFFIHTYMEALCGATKQERRLWVQVEHQPSMGEALGSIPGTIKQRRKRNKSYKYQKQKSKTIFIYILYDCIDKNTKLYKLLESVSELRKLSGYKVNTLKPIIFYIQARNDQKMKSFSIKYIICSSTKEQNIQEQN